MSWNKLSAFSLASFEMNAQMGGTGRYADAVTGVEDQLSLSPQAMGMLGVSLPPQEEASSVGGDWSEEESSFMSEG